MTRFRAYASHISGPQQASYYSQRGSAPGSLLISEATLISHDAGGYGLVPGIYTDAQIQGWKTVCMFFFCHCRSILNLSHGVLAIASGHGRRSCQRIVHLLPAPGTWSRRRSRVPREAGSAFTVVSASSVTMSSSPKPPRPLTEAEIIVAYAKAANNVYMVPDSMGWRYTTKTVTSWISSFKQCPTDARTDGVGTKKAARDLQGWSWTLSAKTESVFALVPGAVSKVTMLR